MFYSISCCVEQFVLPVAGLILRADVTLYPYNSIAIADILSGRGRIVVLAGAAPLQGPAMQNQKNRMLAMDLFLWLSEATTKFAG